jgi:hypothetical protein
MPIWTFPATTARLIRTRALLPTKMPMLAVFWTRTLSNVASMRWPATVGLMAMPKVPVLRTVVLET